MDDGTDILVAVLLGIIGMALLVYAKRQGRLPHGLVGITLMVFPYFVSNVPLMLGIAVALGVGLWASTRFLGW